MRSLSILTLALATSLAVLTPAFAITITARVSGGTIPIHSGPGDNYAIVGQATDGTEIPIDQCTQVDSDSRRGGIADSGYLLWPADSKQWCRIPDIGWVERNSIVGRGLVNVTPPDFAGPGW